MPGNGAPCLREDLVEERDASEDAGGLPEQGRGALAGADDEAAVVEGGRVFGEPGRDLGLPVHWEEVCGVPVLESHFCSWWLGSRSWGGVMHGGVTRL